MSDVFISYARSTEGEARQIAETLRGLGYGVWRDDEIPAHRAFAEVIEERLSASKAVVVVWSADAVASEWVRSEANRARAERKLIQLRVDETRPPMPFDQIQCADLIGWAGEADHAGWIKVAASVGDLVGAKPKPATTPAPASRSSRATICVLPFANMSGDPEQEYFSDGISEDIITDLSKVSALSVVARNTAFTFKGKSVKVPDVARDLGVSHILEGSVRKAGGRVRITAQLIDGAAGDHVWAERYDRDLTDIFALQDEISEAIVKALKLKLLPEEKQAIEQRGTDNVEAYNLYLMARRRLVTDSSANVHQLESVVHLCQAAIEIDPNYARVWALLARAYHGLYFHFGRAGEDALAAAERALALDPSLAEAHAVKGSQLFTAGRHDEARAEIDSAVRLDPDSREVNASAGYLNFREGRLEDAIRHFEKAIAVMEEDFVCAGMLVSCWTALGAGEDARRAARVALERAEKAVAQDRSNGYAMGVGVNALAALGESEQAKNWIRRALLIDPDNLRMRYNLACAASAYLGDADAALDLLTSFFPKTTQSFLNHAKIDPDLNPIRDDPRFQAMIAAAEARLAAATDGAGTKESAWGRERS